MFAHSICCRSISWKLGSELAEVALDGLRCLTVPLEKITNSMRLVPIDGGSVW
jgi:hypothetical protein